MGPESLEVEQSGELEEEEEDAIASTTGSSGSGTPIPGKKKKKKKKKKRSSASKDGTIEASSTSMPKADKEADKRLIGALEAARKGEDLWLDFSCNLLPLAKTKRLLDALNTNDCVTSLNLSSSSVSDEGVQAIAGFLELNGAPALIDLDLRNNPLTEAGFKTLESLQTVRNQLMVRTGSLHTELQDLEASTEDDGVGTYVRDGSIGLADGLSKGKMFNQLFQTNEDDSEEYMTPDEGQLEAWGVNPVELWGSIKDLLIQSPPDIPELSLKLQQLLALLSLEVRAMQPQYSNALNSSKPHMQECVANLDSLRECLALVPRRVTVQYDSEAQDAVGSHRVCAAEVVALMLGPNHRSLDRSVAAVHLVPIVVHLSLSHPLCAALHARALRILKSCMRSAVPGLCVPTLTLNGWGIGLQESPRLLRGLGVPQGDSAEPVDSSSSNGNADPVECRPLPELLAAAATPAVGVPSGLRSRAMGFVIQMCRTLLEMTEAPLPACGKRHQAAEALQSNESWGAFTRGGDASSSPEEGPAGALRVLLAEQDADLCGPKPTRPLVEDASDLASSMSGGLMSGRDILALLQGMSMGGSSGQLGGNV